MNQYDPQMNMQQPFPPVYEPPKNILDYIQLFVVTLLKIIIFCVVIGIIVLILMLSIKGADYTEQKINNILDKFKKQTAVIGNKIGANILPDTNKAVVNYVEIPIINKKVPYAWIVIGSIAGFFILIYILRLFSHSIGISNFKTKLEEKYQGNKNLVERSFETDILKDHIIDIKRLLGVKLASVKEIKNNLEKLEKKTIEEFEIPLMMAKDGKLVAIANYTINAENMEFIFGDPKIDEDHMNELKKSVKEKATFWDYLGIKGLQSTSKKTVLNLFKARHSNLLAVIRNAFSDTLSTYKTIDDKKKAIKTALANSETFIMLIKHDELVTGKKILEPVLITKVNINGISKYFRYSMNSLQNESGVKKGELHAWIEMSTKEINDG